MNLALTADPSTVTVNGLGDVQPATATVYVALPSGVTLPTADGSTLVGVLQLSTTPQNAMRSVPTIIFKVILMLPTSCLRLFNFVTSQGDFTTLLSTVDVNVWRNGPNAGKVRGTNPPQLSDMVVVANTCNTPQTFDLRLALDPSFNTSPNGNPGNAVFTYFSAGYTAPTTSTFNFSSFGTGTPQGQQLCLGPITLPGNTTMLVAAHMAIQAVAVATLPASFSFSASSFEPAAPPAAPSSTGVLSLAASPSTAQATLGYTVR